MSSYSLWLLNLHGKRTILITKHESRRAARSKTCVATQNTVINAVIAADKDCYYISWETRFKIGSALCCPLMRKVTSMKIGEFQALN